MSLDASAVRTWCQRSLVALGRAREEIDAINVYPVPDGDTGTNLFVTMEAITRAVETGELGDGSPHDGRAGTEPGPAEDVGRVLRIMSHAALTGARGNSGVILSQLLRGLTEVLLADQHRDGASLRRALNRAADLCYAGVAEPVEGTLLTVARAAAHAAEATGSADLTAVARAAAAGARAALDQTPRQLDVLRDAGVVDAGGRGLTVILDALVEALTGESAGPEPHRASRHHLPVPGVARGSDLPPGGPAYEVMYLLEAPDAALPQLKETLAGLGDSLVVVGGDGLWNVHVHVDDVGAAIEAGVVAGRPHRIRVTHFAHAATRPDEGRTRTVERAVVCVAHGEGIATLFEQAGAIVVLVPPPLRPSTADILDRIRRSGAREVIVLPSLADERPVTEAAAAQARDEGFHVGVIPARAPVQALAALAVHEPGRRFGDDMVAMTSAAGATRFGELRTASTTPAATAVAAAEPAPGHVDAHRPGDVLGVVDGEVAFAARDLAEAGIRLVDRMLSAGGELVTLVTGRDAPADLAPRIAEHVRTSRPEADTVVYEGGQPGSALLVGVE